MKNGLQNDPRGSKMTPGCSEMTLRGANMEPKEHNIAQNGVERVRGNIEKSMPEKRSAPGRTTLTPFWSQRSTWGSILEVILESFSIKNAIKNRTEIEPQKNMKNHEQSMKNRCEYG